MALDFSLAQKLVPSDDPILRFYGWEPVCLSLGHHQDASEVDLTQLAKDHVDIVRRPTGGSAILHAQELTYSLIVAGENSRHHTIYAAFHHLLASTLRDLGYPVQLHQEKYFLQHLILLQVLLPCMGLQIDDLLLCQMRMGMDHLFSTKVS